MRIVQINGGAKGSTGKIMMGIADVASKCRSCSNYRF